MKMQIKNLILLVSVGIIAVFILFIINQTAQIVDLASRLNPIFGTIVLYTLIIVFIILAALPFVMYRRLPKSLKVPESESSEEYEEYLLALTKRLQSNKYLLSQNLNVKSKDDLPHAINLLEDQANEDIKKTASVIFVTTAVSQSGKLDAFVVLIMLSKMVWRIGHIYNQRPRLKEMLHLYANVAGTSFIAMGLDEIDIGEQVDQILGNVIGPSAFGSLPGFEQVATFLTTAMIDGTANAYLTLRVGAITKSYCGSLVKPNRKSLRRFASIEAAGILGKIVKTSSSKVIDSILQVIRRKFGNKVKENWEDLTKKIKSIFLNPLSRMDF